MRLAPAACGFALAIAASLCAAQAPYTPRAAEQVLLQRAATRLPGAVPLAELKAEHLARPTWLPSATAYARSALELARREDDPRYLGIAQAALKPWWASPDAPPEARLLRAAIRLARKDFAAARADLDALVRARGPEAASAALSRSALALLQGQPAAALADCRAVAGQVPPLAAATCLAAAEGLGPEPGTALRRLESALRAADDSSLASQTWAASVAAELALRAGDAATAERHFARALQAQTRAQTRDPGLLASYADAVLQQAARAPGAASARPLQSAIQRLQGQERIDGLLLRLALLRQQMLTLRADAGQAALLESERAQLAERFAQQKARGDLSHLREHALYDLHWAADPTEALRSAARNWQLQREPIDALLLLRAAKRAGQAPEAAPNAALVQQWLAETGLMDARIQSALGATSASNARAPD